MAEEKSIEEVEIGALEEDVTGLAADIDIIPLEMALEEEVSPMGLPAGSFVGFRTYWTRLNPDCSNGKTIDTQTIFIRAPRGARRGFAFILAWDIYFGCRGYGEDHNFGRQYISVTSQRWIGTGLLVTVRSLLRDKNGDDRWKGAIRVGAAFFS